MVCHVMKQEFDIQSRLTKCARKVVVSQCLIFVTAYFLIFVSREEVLSTYFDPPS